MVTLVRVAVFWEIGAAAVVKYVPGDSLQLLDKAYKFVAVMQHIGVGPGPDESVRLRTKRCKLFQDGKVRASRGYETKTLFM
jgi:hypothetical protein